MSRRSEVSKFNSELKIRPEDLNQNKHVTETPSHTVSRTGNSVRSGTLGETEFEYQRRLFYPSPLDPDWL